MTKSKKDGNQVWQSTQLCFRTVTEHREDLRVASKVLLVFASSFSGPCNLFDDTLDALVDERGDELLVTYADLDNEVALGEMYDVRAAPASVYFKDGEIVGAFVGAVPLKEVLKWLELKDLESSDGA